MKNITRIDKKIEKNTDSSKSEIQRIRITLTSREVKVLEDVSTDLIRCAKLKLFHVRGPVPLPTKVMRITTRKSPCGNGTATFDKFEMRIHKRIVEIHSSSDEVRQIITTVYKPDVAVEVTGEMRTTNVINKHV
jgi:small subunit ribosomal protein S20e